MKKLILTIIAASICVLPVLQAVGEDTKDATAGKPACCPAAKKPACCPADKASCPAAKAVKKAEKKAEKKAAKKATKEGAKDK